MVYLDVPIFTLRTFPDDPNLKTYFLKATDNSELIRNTTNGLVLGEKRVNSKQPNQEYLAFHAIPYASPPVGNLRLKPPLAHSNWNNTYDASKQSIVNKCCIQVGKVFLVTCCTGYSHIMS